MDCSKAYILKDQPQQFDYCCHRNPKDVKDVNKYLCEFLERNILSQKRLHLGESQDSKRVIGNKYTQELKDKYRNLSTQNLKEEYKNECKILGLFNRGTEDCKMLKKEIDERLQHLKIDCNEDVSFENKYQMKNQCCNSWWKRNFTNKKKCKEVDDFIQQPVILKKSVTPEETNIAVNMENVNTLKTSQAASKTSQINDMLRKSENLRNYHNFSPQHKKDYYFQLLSHIRTANTLGGRTYMRGRTDLVSTDNLLKELNEIEEYNNLLKEKEEISKEQNGGRRSYKRKRSRKYKKTRKLNKKRTNKKRKYN